MLSSLISFVVALYVLFSMSLSVFTRQHSRLPAEYSAEKGSQTGRRRHREHEKDQPYSSDDSEELMVLIFQTDITRSFASRVIERLFIVMKAL